MNTVSTVAGLVTLLWLTPAVAIALILLIARPRWAEFLNLASASVVLLITLALVVLSATLHEPMVWWHDYLLLDPFGAWVLLCVGLVYFLSALHAIGYMRLLPEEAPRLPSFYALKALFALTMLIAPLLNQPGLYWIAIDLTTIVSAFLVGFERAPEPIEAAWKYLIIVSAGLSLALLGIVLFYWGGSFSAGMVYTLSWSELARLAPQISPPLAALAFMLVLVGFGTKVGLAPMHTWLPDAHSEGPAPVSAMLSGALLNTALLGIVRFQSAMAGNPIAPLSHWAMIILGVFSLLIAALFIVQQTGIKRLMAYSSVEHMGLLTLAFGIGGPLGVAAGMYHMLNHSLTKSALFFSAGNLMRAYHTKSLAQMQGFARHFPGLAMAFAATGIAITGAPPFGLFRAELAILTSGFAAGYGVVMLIVALLLVMIFIAFAHQLRLLLFGLPHSPIPEPKLRQLPAWSMWPIVLVLPPIVVMGVWWPSSFTQFFAHAQALLP